MKRVTLSSLRNAFSSREVNSLDKSMELKLTAYFNLITVDLSQTSTPCYKIQIYLFTQYTFKFSTYLQKTEKYVKTCRVAD